MKSIHGNRNELKKISDKAPWVRLLSPPLQGVYSTVQKKKYIL